MQAIVIAWLSGNAPFPGLDEALTDPNGLLAVGGDLSPDRLLAAYKHGIFPWYSEGQPILWWSPDPRMVLFVDEFKIARSLRKRIRQQQFSITVDTAFQTVVRQCANARRKGQFGTWITEPMVEAYVRLYDLGYAHSVEAWLEGSLVGGLYGLSLGRVFFGESMFSHVADASKVALAALVTVLRQLGVFVIDCQQETQHLSSLGAQLISRKQFAKHLSDAIPPDRLRTEGWEDVVVSLSA